MHIVLGLLTMLVSIFYLLDRLGIDIGGLNPFFWYRRRAFAKRYGSDPIYSIEDPIHIAALLVIGAGQLEGALTADQKRTAQAQFETELSLDPKEASQLFGSASHLLAAPQLLADQLGKLVDRNTNRFSAEQAQSLISMMTAVVSADGEPSASQKAYIENIRSKYVGDTGPSGTWG